MVQRKKIGTKPVEVDDLYREEEWEGNVEEGKISLGIKSLLRHQGQQGITDLLAPELPNELPSRCRFPPGKKSSGNAYESLT